MKTKEINIKNENISMVILNENYEVTEISRVAKEKYSFIDNDLALWFDENEIKHFCEMARKNGVYITPIIEIYSIRLVFMYNEDAKIYNVLIESVDKKDNPKTTFPREFLNKLDTIINENLFSLLLYHRNNDLPISSHLKKISREYENISCYLKSFFDFEIFKNNNVVLSEFTRNFLRPFQKITNISYRVNDNKVSYPILTNSHYLAIIYVNILSNVYRHSAATTLTVTIQDSDDSITIKFTDNGKGMSENLCKSAFILFNTSNEKKREFLGIGLNVARELALSLGGDISLSSVVNFGTTVTLTLPKIMNSDLKFTALSSTEISLKDEFNILTRML